MDKFRKIDELSKNEVVNLALDTISLKKQGLVFVNTKRSSEKAAEDIAAKIKVSSKELDDLSEKVKRVLSKPTRQCERLSNCLKKGIAFHHAGLTHKQREIIEDEFRSGKIKIICSTPTLAAGLDLPAFRTIIRDLKRYGHHGLTWIPVLEYLQQAGRAGRPKYDSWGESIAIASTDGEKEDIYDHYITGEPEEIQSKLAVEPVLRTYLLSLIHTNFVRNKEEIMDFFSRTFWAFQYEDMFRLESIIDKMLSLLEDWGFILRSSSKRGDFVDADSLGVEKFSATPVGHRVAELYIDPLTAHHIITCLRRTNSKILTSISFLQMVSSTLEMRPLLKVGIKEFASIQSHLATIDSSLLTLEPSLYDPDYQDFINSIKTALFFNSWIDEIDEETLLEDYGIRPGETRVKLEIAQWLLYCSNELSRILELKDLQREISKVRVMVRYGVKEELLPLIKLEGIGRVRARILFNNRIRDLGDIKKTDVSLLSHLVGSKVAQSIKEQVGEKVSQVPSGRRKGQLSIRKYGVDSSYDDLIDEG